ncbi:MAG: cytochrome c biogenesis protein CcsA, partial [Deltaproteobacteria bacterium]|nr:cytochrome c biogenesis protein CcsA [Deltaproteobacteria bacterium]
MYESLVFMGWGALALGLALEIWQRRRIVAASAALLGFLCLAFAENLPIDSNINPLMPVLAHTSWLAVHAMTIMLAYSAFGLAMLVGHALLFVEVFRKDRTPLLGWLSKVLYKTIQIGVLFLAAGIVFGAIWANEGWGRYWAWDPKETWSLVTFFVYLAIIHARFAGWLRNFGLAASAVLGFLAVIMTYYGVNFILASGMHAYGFAEGGQFSVAAYALAECAIVVAAQIMRTTLGRLLAGALVTLAAAFVPVSAPRAVCLGGGTSPLPLPSAEFLRSYRASFGNPTRLAVDSTGNVYIADAARGTATVRSPDGRIVSLVSGLENPVSIGASGSGYFYVGDGTNGSVAAVSFAGEFLFDLGQGAGEFGMPADIAIDTLTGNIYVTDSAQDRVKIYDVAGAFSASFGVSGSGDGEFKFPTGIFVDGAANEVLVVDQLNFRVQSFTLDGTYNFCLGYLRESAFNPRRDFNAPQGVWADALGRVFVADAVDGTIKVLDRDGPLLGTIGEIGTRPGQLRIPMDLVIDPFGRLFVASANNARLEVFGLDEYSDPEKFIPADVEMAPYPLDRATPPAEISAYVEIPGYRLEHVQPDSVVANGVVANSVSVADWDADGIPDLKAAFDYEELFDTLPRWGTADVKVGGALGAYVFEGTGSIEVVAYPCANGIDDDRDGLIDRDDPGCRNWQPSSLENPQCDDGIDNDGDGFIDGRDRQCRGRAWWDHESRWGMKEFSLDLGAERIMVLPPLLWLCDRRRRRARRCSHRARRAAAIVAFFCVSSGLTVPEMARALDPPHDYFSNSIDCGNCHLPHGAPGGAITRVAGNPNLCMSCHTPGGLAAARSF